MTENKTSRYFFIGLALLVLPLVLQFFGNAWVRIAEDDAAPVPAPAPVISVHLVRPLHTPLQVHAPATGSVAAWEEASIGAEANGLRLTDVKVNVGDTVQRGQLLASFNPGLIEAELGEAVGPHPDAHPVLGTARQVGLGDARRAEDGVADEARGGLRHPRLDGQAVLRRGLDHAEVADPGQRQGADQQCPDQQHAVLRRACRREWRAGADVQGQRAGAG
mgnify:CR=1 FL=1